MHFYARFQKRSEKIQNVFKLPLKIQNVFGLKAFGMFNTNTFRSELFFRTFFDVTRYLFDIRGNARIQNVGCFQNVEIEN